MLFQFQETTVGIDSIPATIGQNQSMKKNKKSSFFLVDTSQLPLENAWAVQGKRFNY